MSGRGLGHTGGTLDKLESIPGFRVQLPQGEFLRQLERIGVAVVSQSERVVPADRVLYALRDVTGTVESDGLIAASIMAKKVASGTSALVLDVKVGRGAFMSSLEHARELGRLCRLIAAEYDRPAHLHLHGMDAPLGRAVGNRIEVEEAWQVLCGEGPDDVRETTLAVAGALLALSDLGVDEAEGRRRAEAALADGRAAEHFERWCYVQGGRWTPGEFHRLAGEEVRAAAAGYVTAADALAVGRAAQLAGAGRRTMEDTVDPAAGVLLERRPATRWRPATCWPRCSRGTAPGGAPRSRCWHRRSAWARSRRDGTGGAGAGLTLVRGLGLHDRVAVTKPHVEPGAEQLAGDGAGQAHGDVPGAQAEAGAQQEDEGDGKVDRQEPLPGELADRRAPRAERQVHGGGGDDEDGEELGHVPRFRWRPRTV